MQSIELKFLIKGNLLRFLGANNTCNHRPMIQSDSQTKTLKAFSIDLIEHWHQSYRKFHHDDDIMFFSTAFILLTSKLFPKKGKKESKQKTFERMRVSEWCWRKSINTITKSTVCFHCISVLMACRRNISLK